MVGAPRVYAIWEWIQAAKRFSLAQILFYSEA
jgi:hypothetical protein